MAAETVEGVGDRRRMKDKVNASSTEAVFKSPSLRKDGVVLVGLVLVPEPLGVGFARFYWTTNPINC